MISCTEFIPAYSELFKFLEEQGGKKAVVEYWEFLSKEYLGNLETLVKEKGLLGCYEYWSHSLKEEAADFTMKLDEGNGVFIIEMQHCPSKSRLNERTDMEPYKDYCLHCDVLYRRVLEPLGYRYSIDLSRCGRARCTIRVSAAGQKEIGVG